MATTITEAQAKGIVLGLQSTGDPVHRRDIDDLLLHEPDAFNLFLLALIDLKKDSSATDKMGYYQIAGIHGLPRAPWDGVTSTGKDKSDVATWAGYCPHSTDIFATWHRPYLAMIEQTIYDRMAKIAESFEQEDHKQIYRNAIKKFRLPYWDYYRPRAHEKTTFDRPDLKKNRKEFPTSFEYSYHIPEIFTKETIMLRTVEDKNELRPKPNPLNFFQFPSKEKDKVWTQKLKDRSTGEIKEYQFWKAKTQRHPEAGDPVEAVKLLNKVLNMNREPDNEYCNNMILDEHYDGFGNFISNKENPKGTAGSLEDLHNGYHGYIGGNGQMGNPLVAAFDPVFWIHHVQIDRIFAIWQASHPTQWYPKNETTGSNSDLVPFRFPNPTEKKIYWTPNDSEHTKTFGYIYKDTEFASPEDVRKAYREKYLWAIRKTADETVVCPPDMKPYPLSDAQVFKTTTVAKTHRVVQEVVSSVVTAVQGLAANIQGTSAKEADTSEVGNVTKFTVAKDRVFALSPQSDVSISNPEQVDESKVNRRWYIDNSVERLALNGTFTIFYFIGPFDDNDVDGWRVAPSLVGTSHNFAAPVELCDNCGRQEEVALKVTGTSAITPILLDYVANGELADLTPASVEPFLVEHLKWRVVKFDEGPVDPRIVRGLQIGISCLLNPVPPETGRSSVQEFPTSSSRSSTTLLEERKLLLLSHEELRILRGQIAQARNFKKNIVNPFDATKSDNC